MIFIKRYLNGKRFVKTIGIQGRDIYLVDIKYDHWWQYIPFHDKIVHGKEELRTLTKKLSDQGYKFGISEYCFFSREMSYMWRCPPVSSLERILD